MADPLDILYGRPPQREEGLGTTLANLAGAIASISERRMKAAQQRAELEQHAQEAEIRRGYLTLQQQELAQKQKMAQTQQLINGIAGKYIKPSADGSYQTVDRAGLAQALSSAGAPPEEQLRYAKLMDEIDHSTKASADARDQNIADIANSVLKSSKNPTMPEVAFAVALAKKNHHEITDEQLSPLYEAMASGDESALKPLLVQIRSQMDKAGKYKEAAKTVKLGPDDVLVPEEGGEPVARNPVAAEKPTEAMLDVRFQELQKKAALGQPLTPDERAEMQAYRTRKTLVPSAVFSMNAPTRENAREDRAYQFQQKRIDDARKPIASQVERIDRLESALNAQTPQADALLAPEVLSIMAGGQGSGLRMNEAEIGRIIGGRSKWESLKATLNQWSLDPSKALSVTPEQRKEMRDLVRDVSKRARGKLKVLDDAGESLAGVDTVEKGRSLVNSALKDLETASTDKVTFTVQDVKDLMARSGATYEQAKAALEAKGHVVK